MKNIFNFLIFILTFVPIVKSQSYDHNYIKQTILRVEETNFNNVSGLSTGEILENISYSDGFGRTLQLISKGASPNMKDIVAFNVYDSYGRIPKNYLPYSSNDADGNYKSDAIGNQATFYRQSPRVAHTYFPFSQTIYDNSPLQRIERQGATGAFWQPGVLDEHLMQFEYGSNDEGEVYIWTLNESSNYCTSSQTFGTNLLYTRTVKDMNWDGTNGGLKTVYYDKFGRVILDRVRLDASTYAKTYYVYDDFGNLRFIIPPKAIKLMEDASNLNTSSLSQDLVYWFKYDEKQRLVERKVPGKEVEYIIYDITDRIVLTQDGNLRNDDKWNFIKYDKYSRPIITGLYHNTIKVSRASMQSFVDDFVDNTNTFLFEEFTGVTAQNEDGYSEQAFPQTASEIYKIMYYDNYEFDINGDYEFSYFTGLWDPSETDPFERITGAITGMKVKILGSSPAEFLFTVFYYDEYGRLIRAVADNHLYGKEFVDNKFFFSGEMEKSYLYKATNINSTLEETTISYSYIRDHMGRLLKIKSKINNEDEITMAELKYNEVGQVIEKNLHSESSSDYLQSIDYKYNIWGLVTNINNSNIGNDNEIINLDTELDADEMVYGIKYDTINVSIVEEVPGGGEPNILNLNFTDSKKLLICKIDDPTNKRELNLSETSTVSYAEGDIPVETYQYLATLDGEEFTIDYNNIKFDTYFSSSFVQDTLDKLNRNQLYAEGITEQELLDKVVIQFAQYQESRIAVIYFNEDSDDLFGMDILYEKGFTSLNGTQQFNGNISGIKWQTTVNEGLRGYGYQYDNLGRLNSANYGELSSSGTWDQNTDRFSVYNISYDLNGNLLSMDRKGLTGRDAQDNAIYGIMDELSYSYSGNQLTSVNDDIDNVPLINDDFHDNQSSGSNEYTYDDNGNITSDENKGITSITYNYLNLPEKIYFGANNHIEFIYTASGQKLTKKIFRNSTTNIAEQKDYSGIFVYSDGEMEFILTGQGRAMKQTDGSFRKDYFIADHLGNNRVVFTKGEGNAAEVIQENHYYPFGMTLGGLDYYSALYNDYLYQGKELQKDGFDLQGGDDVLDTKLLWHDFHARFYNAQLGRFHVPDPIINEASPYVGMMNNPVIITDPSGMTPGGDDLKWVPCDCPGGGRWEGLIIPGPSDPNYHGYEIPIIMFPLGCSQLNYSGGGGSPPPGGSGGSGSIAFSGGFSGYGVLGGDEYYDLEYYNGDESGYFNTHGAGGNGNGWLDHNNRNEPANFNGWRSLMRARYGIDPIELEKRERISSLKRSIGEYKSLISSASRVAANSGDGLTWSEAKAHYQFGGGTPVDVQLSSIDLSKVSMADFNERGLATIRLDTRHFSSTNDALVHGTITLQLIPGTNQAKIALNSGRDYPQLAGQPGGMYNFEMQSWGSAINWVRNPATFIGGLINGTFLFPGPIGPIPIYTGGTPFPIYYHGTVTIPQ